MGLLNFLTMSSKVTNAYLLECISKLRKDTKARKFRQTVELQISLKDYDPSKDKRFVGSVVLPNCPRENLKICLIADAKHQDEAKNTECDVEVTTLDDLKKFNKDKKLIKGWAKKYSMLIATDALVKKIPAVCGPTLNRIGMFPQPVSHAAPLKGKINDIRSTVKWQLKKVTCMNVAAGHEKMTDDQLRQNIIMALNFLASLTKKGWHNVKTVNIKCTMGKAIKVL